MSHYKWERRYYQVALPITELPARFSDYSLNFNTSWVRIFKVPRYLFTTHEPWSARAPRCCVTTNSFGVRLGFGLVCFIFVVYFATVVNSTQDSKEPMRPPSLSRYWKHRSTYSASVDFHSTKQSRQQGVVLLQIVSLVVCWQLYFTVRDT